MDAEAAVAEGAGANPMNPFDWHGPAFLGFYLLLTLAVLAGIYYLRATRELDAARGRMPVDPYEIAYLRAGPAGAISVAMVSLLERGHLTTNDGMLTSVAAKETPAA